MTEAVVVSKRGVLLFQHSKTQLRWGDDIARRAVETVKQLKSSFGDELPDMRIGPARVYLTEGDYVVLVVKTEGGELPPNGRTQLRDAIKELERRHRAGLTAIKTREAMPGLEEEIAQLLGLG